MATVVAPLAGGIPFAVVKRDCGKIAELLSRGGYLTNHVDAGMIDVLKAIHAAAETTNLTIN